MNTIFWAAMKLLLLSFPVLFCFLIPRTLNPIFVLAKIIFPPMEKYTALTTPPPLPPFLCHYISNTALCMALSKAFWTMCYFQHKRSDSLGFKRMANRKTNLAPSTLKLKTKIVLRIFRIL